MTLDVQDGVALLRLDNGKANAIDHELLALLDTTLSGLEAAGARALVLTGVGRVFSAGLDLPTLSTYDRAAMTRFLDHFEAVITRMLGCPQPLVAAVNGHAVAGGCVLALTADWRVGSEGPFKLGLNEAALGLGLPPSVEQTVKLQLTTAQAGRVLLEGALHDPDAALELGLLDAVVTPDEVTHRALDHARRLAAVPASGFRAAKLALRRTALEALAGSTRAAREAWLDGWFSEETRGRVEAMLAALADRGKDRSA